MFIVVFLHSVLMDIIYNVAFHHSLVWKHSRQLRIEYIQSLLQFIYTVYVPFGTSLRFCTCAVSHTV